EITHTSCLMKAGRSGRFITPTASRPSTSCPGRKYHSRGFTIRYRNDGHNWYEFASLNETAGGGRRSAPRLGRRLLDRALFDAAFAIATDPGQRRTLCE